MASTSSSSTLLTAASYSFPLPLSCCQRLESPTFSSRNSWGECLCATKRVAQARRRCKAPETTEYPRPLCFIPGLLWDGSKSDRESRSIIGYTISSHLISLSGLIVLSSSSGWRHRRGNRNQFGAFTSRSIRGRFEPVHNLCNSL